MITILKHLDWQLIKQAALTTRGLSPRNAVTSDWKSKALLSEHSMLYFSSVVIAVDMQYKTAAHLVRHNKTKGFYMLVQSQRPDWTGKPRDPEATVRTIITATPAALIEASRTRLCHKAADHTRTVWEFIIGHIGKTEPELAAACVPNCQYRGKCTEFEPCGRKHD